jgi:hypothetical protein
MGVLSAILARAKASRAHPALHHHRGGAATAEIPGVATDSPVQMGCHLALPRSRPIAIAGPGADPTPEPRGEGGHREMLLLWAGDEIGSQRLIRRTATQMPPIPMAATASRTGRLWWFGDPWGGVVVHLVQLRVSC